jgi:anti-sigma regulatory factor (Ser/Thr protein kinase)
MKPPDVIMSRPGRYKTIELRIGNRIAEMKTVAEGVNKFGADHALPKSVLNDVNVALDEILNNTINYGYLDDKRHEIVVSLSLAHGELVAEVRDDGMPFNPLEAPGPDLSGGRHERRVGGIGVHLVRSLMDDIEYARSDGSNRLRMRKRVGT